MAIIIILAVAAILLIGGVSIGVLAIGIHSGCKSRHLSVSPRTRAESVARKILGMTVRTNNPTHRAPKEG
jgi:hypothetical protein